MRIMITDKQKKRTGSEGEDIACDYLLGQGHAILERNWRSGHLEIDIISLDSKGIHFVEVKTRRPPYQALPQDSVTMPKQRNVAKAAGAYMRTARGRKVGDAEIWFDIVAVILGGDGSRSVEYIPGAYTPIFI